MDRDAEVFRSTLLKSARVSCQECCERRRGATKFIEILVKGARDREDAKRAAYAIAHSPLVKTAFFGEDANWGRILSAWVSQGQNQTGPNRSLLRQGPDRPKRGGDRDSTGGMASLVIKKRSFKVTVDLHIGKSEFSVYTTDLSIDYVKINASYRS